MKILLAIPSKNRLDIFTKNAYRWLKYVYHDWVVFLEPQDCSKYKEIININTYELPENNKGLGYAKQHIKDYAQKHGYDLIFKIDDDIKGFTDFRKVLSPEESAHFIDRQIVKIVDMFNKYPNLGAIAFPYRFEMYEFNLWERTKRIQTAYITRVNSFYSNKNISVFEDFAAGLYILAQGKAIIRASDIGLNMGIDVGKGTGGHQSYNREEQALKEVEELRKIYPPLKFRKVNKPWKIEPDLRSVDL